MFFPLTVLATTIRICDLVNGERSVESGTVYEEDSDGTVRVFGLDEGVKTITLFAPIEQDGKTVYQATQEVWEKGNLVSSKKWIQVEPPSTSTRIYRLNRNRRAEKTEAEKVEALARMRAEARKFYEIKYGVTAQDIESAIEKLKSLRPSLEGEELENLAESYAIVHGSKILEVAQGYVSARKPDRAKLRRYLMGEESIYDTIDPTDINQVGFHDFLGSLNALRTAGLKSVADAQAISIFRNVP